MFPHRDVYDFSKALEELGFRVLSMVDLTLVEMRTMMLAFSKLLGKGVFSVFYFAGHGYEVNGENYLMPIDAKSSEHLDEFLSAQEMLNVRSAFLYIYLLFYIYLLSIISTGQDTDCTKMAFSVKDFFSKCDQICMKLPIWSHLLK